MPEAVFETIIVKGEETRVEIANVPIEEIELDLDNPRLRHRNWNGKGPEDLIRAMPDTPKLLKDIEENRGLLEKPFLQSNGKGKYKAKEGNRRVLCVSDLHVRYPDDPAWKTVPARILPADTSPKTLAILLADWHVAGKVKWDAHEKAGQVYHMNQNLKIPLKEILVHLHASKSTVERWLKAYTFMFERFLKIDKGKYSREQDREDRWSYFDELYRSKELKQRNEEDPEFGNKFCRWVGEKRLPKGEAVRKLAAIIKNPDALRAFETLPVDKAFSEAMTIVERADPELGSDFFKLLAEVRRHCTDIGSVREIMRIRTDKVAEERVMDTYKAFVGFMRLAELEPPPA